MHAASLLENSGLPFTGRACYMAIGTARDSKLQSYLGILSSWQKNS